MPGLGVMANGLAAAVRRESDHILNGLVRRGQWLNDNARAIDADLSLHSGAPPKRLRFKLAVRGRDLVITHAGTGIDYPTGLTLPVLTPRASRLLLPGHTPGRTLTHR
jgi:hypothetical protein